MKIDFSQELKTFDGEIIKMRAAFKQKILEVFDDASLDGSAMLEKIGELLKDRGEINQSDKCMTLRSQSVEALLTPLNGDSGSDKAESSCLAMKIHQSDGELDLESEAIVKLKDRIGKTMTALVVGQCWNMLEGNEDQPEQN